jgi:hypothetical protein
LTLGERNRRHDAKSGRCQQSLHQARFH